MKQYEAVIKIMEENGGYATLGFLNQNVLRIKECEWKTKTPFASIRRIVQDDRFFFKIKPGLWALKSYKNKLPFEILPTENVSEKKTEEFSHSYYQGLLVEIGNLKNYQTFVPYQDKNKLFLGKKLGDLASINSFYNFSYDRIINRAKTVDISWFNLRGMPAKLFEVDYSTPFQNSLLKFTELQDFFIEFYIVSDEMRKMEYDSKISSSTFLPIQQRVKFLNYDRLSEWHTKTYEIATIEKEMEFA